METTMTVAIRLPQAKEKTRALFLAATVPPSPFFPSYIFTSRRTQEKKKNVLCQCFQEQLEERGGAVAEDVTGGRVNGWHKVLSKLCRGIAHHVHVRHWRKETTVPKITEKRSRAKTQEVWKIKKCGRQECATTVDEFVNHHGATYYRICVTFGRLYGEMKAGKI
ncbi:hypothetical protein CBL_12410 [Carabus blaptoides fortunei]